MDTPSTLNPNQNKIRERMMNHDFQSKEMKRNGNSNDDKMKYSIISLSQSYLLYFLTTAMVGPLNKKKKKEISPKSHHKSHQFQISILQFNLSGYNSTIFSQT